jgi:L-ascorbate metabolism protein UlaG (beta-lactamase superfamily)
MCNLTYVGHATVLIEMNGMRILTDPLLRNRVWHLSRQVKRIDPGMYQNISTILISHAHSDHLDLPSLKLLDRNIPVIAPRGAAALLRRGGFKNIVELSTGERSMVGPVVVNAARADHNGARFRFNTPVETLGYVIDGSQRIYFAGDTELFPEMDAIAEDLDVAFLPVWGWGPSLGPGHMDPYQAAQALQMLKPRYAIPIHWGTYFPFGFKWLMPRILTEPPRLFASFAARFAPDVKVKIISPGETFRIDD